MSTFTYCFSTHLRGTCTPGVQAAAAGHEGSCPQSDYHTSVDRDGLLMGPTEEPCMKGLWKPPLQHVLRRAP